MPVTGGKYDDVWMWTRDSKSSTLAAFVNFKKAKSGWADKNYKGYVICSRSVGKTVKENTGISKLKKPFLFEYKGKIWQSDMTDKGTKPFGDYRLLHEEGSYFSGNADGTLRSVGFDHSSGIIHSGAYDYFFTYKGKSKKLDVYRSNGTIKGTKKIGNLGKKVVYYPVKVSHNLYFIRGKFVPAHEGPPDEELWVLDMYINKLKRVRKMHDGEGAKSFFPFAKNKRHVFFQSYHWDEKSKINYQELWINNAQNRGLKKVQQFKDKIPNDLHNVTIDGKSYKVQRVYPPTWSKLQTKGDFSIGGKALLYRSKNIVNLLSVEDLKVYDVELVYNGKKHSIVASNGYLWAVDSRGNIKILKEKK